MRSRGGPKHSVHRHARCADHASATSRRDPPLQIGCGPHPHPPRPYPRASRRGRPPRVRRGPAQHGPARVGSRGRGRSHARWYVYCAAAPASEDPASAPSGREQPRGGGREGAPAARQGCGVRVALRHGAAPPVSYAQQNYRLAPDDAPRRTLRGVPAAGDLPAPPVPRHPGGTAGRDTHRRAGRSGTAARLSAGRASTSR